VLGSRQIPQEVLGGPRKFSGSIWCQGCEASGGLVCVKVQEPVQQCVSIESCQRLVSGQLAGAPVRVLPSATLSQVCNGVWCPAEYQWYGLWFGLRTSLAHMCGVLWCSLAWSCSGAMFCVCSCCLLWADPHIGHDFRVTFLKDLQA
jgi:hypothetical protein